MSDERYDRSADMRLLELQREALGAPRHVLRSTSYSDPDPLTAALPDDDIFEATSGTMLVALLDAQPRKGLIAGALVTISLSVGNDGDAVAQGVRTSIPLPVNTVYRPGSLTIDGAPADENVAGDLFANGIELGNVPPGGRRTLAVKVIVESGLADIIISPHLSASSGAILGLRAVRLTRGTPLRAVPSVERPFYESDESEHVLEPLSAHPRETAPQAPEYPPVEARIEPAPLPLLAPEIAAALSEKVAPKTVVPSVRGGSPKAVRKPKAQPEPKAPLESQAQPESNAQPELEAQPVAQPPAAPAGSVEPAVLLPVPVSLPVVEAAVSAAVVPSPASNPSTASTSTEQIAKAVVKAITKPKPKPKAKAKPKLDPPVSTRVPASAPAPAPLITAPVRIEGKGGPILTVRVDRKRLATLARLFNGPSLGMIAHYLVLNALATNQALPGHGDDRSIAAFVTEQEQLLSRVLITNRLGKTPAPDSIAAALPVFPPAVTQHTGAVMIGPSAPGEALLVRTFVASEMMFLERMLTNAKAPAFLRAAQLFVALCGNEVITATALDRQPVSDALIAYAALATTEISRIFLRAKLTRTPTLFKETEPAFDAAARNVLHELSTLIA